MSDELEVLKSVTARLGEAGIPYMVRGAMAANFHTVPRMTRDIDLVVELSERDADRVTLLFQQEFYIDRDMVLRAVRDHAMFNMIHNARVVNVDCVVGKDSEYRRQEFARRRPVTIAGQQVSVVAQMISFCLNLTGRKAVVHRCNEMSFGTCSGRCKDSIQPI